MILAAALLVFLNANILQLQYLPSNKAECLTTLYNNAVITTCS